MPDISDNKVMILLRELTNKTYKVSNNSKLLGKALEVRDYFRILDCSISHPPYTQNSPLH